MTRIRELTTPEAAEWLGQKLKKKDGRPFKRDYVVTLLDQYGIPYRKVHPRKIMVPLQSLRDLVKAHKHVKRGRPPLAVVLAVVMSAAAMAVEPAPFTGTEGGLLHPNQPLKLGGSEKSQRLSIEKQLAQRRAFYRTIRLRDVKLRLTLGVPPDMFQQWRGKPRANWYTAPGYKR